LLHFFTKRTARQQWGIFLVGLFLLLASIVAVFTWYVFKQVLSENVDDSRNLATNAAVKLSAILEDDLQFLAGIAASPEAQRLGSKSCDPVIAFMRNFRSNPYERIWLVTTSGELVCAPEGAAADRALVTTQHPWFQSGLKADGFSIGHAFLTFPTARWTIPLTQTVRDAQNRVIGLVVLAVDLKSLQKRIFIDGETPGGFRGGITDENNLLLLHNDPALIGTKIDPNSQRTQALGNETFRVLGLDNTWRYCGAAQPKGTTWRAFFCTPEDVALATARKDATYAALVGIGIFGLFALGIFLFSRINIDRDDSNIKRVSDLTRLQDFLWSNIPVGLAFFDSNGVTMEANDQLATMMRRPREGLIGKKLNEFAVESNDQQRIGLEKSGYGRWTSAFKRSDGTTIDIETTVRKFTADNLDVIIGVFRDFTDLKHAETELRKSEELLEQTGRIAGIGGWELDSVTTPPRWTSNTRRIHEVQDDFVPTLDTALEFFPKETRAVITKAVSDGFAFGIPYDMEVPFITAKGRSLWVRVVGQPLLENGKVVRLVGSFQDITERRLAERELEEQRAKAEIANNAKSSFLAIMSHELRTPLTGILGMADLLSAEKLAPQHQDFVERLSKSGRILLDLINDVLDFSKIEANKLTIDRVPFVPREIFDSVRDLLAPLAAEKNLTLIFAVANDLSTSILGDPKRLRQVLTNLVGNAVKFTSQGRIIVNATVQNLASGESIMCVRVADTGAGISIADQANLFKPYVQGGAHTVGRAGGTGLGLAISRLLVEAMGGEITVSTQEGEGSTFTFTVKLYKDRTSTVADPIKAKATAALPQRSLRILLGEDNETSRYLVSEVMRRKSHTVDVAVNGADALLAAKQQDYDIILMDMQMPVMSGMDAVHEIRQLENSNASAPIIALTADIIEESRAKYLAAGVDAVVAKPINWSTLELEMTRLLDTPKDMRRQLIISSGYDPTEQNPPALDVEALRELASFLGPDKLLSLLVTFKQNVTAYRIDMQKHIEAGDLKQAKRTAHALRGLSIQFGALRLGKVATEIETKLESIEQIIRVMPTLDQLIAAAFAAIESLPTFSLSEVQYGKI